MTAIKERVASNGISFLNINVTLGDSGIKKDVLKDINLKINPGEMVAFAGPSGAGKTTLLRLLNGSVSPSSGEVCVADQQVTSLRGKDLRTLRRGIGFIHQDLRLVPNLRVSQNVLSGKLGAQNMWQSLRMILKPSSFDLAEVHDLLGRVGIPDKIFQRVDRLSGGEAQRVAVARALIQKPTIMVADEPVSSVDPTRARGILELLTGICKQDGLTLCVSLHDPELVKEFFPRVVGLRAGEVVLDQSTANLTSEQLAQLYALEAGRGE